MAERAESKVAFNTGATRGQGRSHALGLTKQSAYIIGLDVTEQTGHEALLPGRVGSHRRDGPTDGGPGPAARSSTANARDFAGVRAALAKEVDQLGRLDIACANAGIFLQSRPFQCSPTKPDAHPQIEPISVRNTVLLLASNQPQYITTTELEIDTDHTAR